jgi:hypothetical protein
MAFWTDSSLQPLQSFRFRVQTTLGPFVGQWWWTKSVDLPTYDVNVNEYQLGNHKFKYPGVVTWQDVTVTVVDTATVANKLLQNLNSMGYKKPEEELRRSVGGGLAKDPRTQQVNVDNPQQRISTFLDESVMTSIIFQQLNADGGIIQTWTLKNAFVKSVNFGRLSYEEDGLQEIIMTFSYDYIDYQYGSDSNASVADAVVQEGGENNPVSNPMEQTGGETNPESDVSLDDYDNTWNDPITETKDVGGKIQFQPAGEAEAVHEWTGTTTRQVTPLDP